MILAQRQNIDQWNKIESPEINPCTYDSLSLTKEARILEWVAMPSSRESSRLQDRAHVSQVCCIGRRVLYHQQYLGRPCIGKPSKSRLPWDKAHLVMGYDLFNVLLDSDCQNFVKDFCIYVHVGFIPGMQRFFNIHKSINVSFCHLLLLYPFLCYAETFKFDIVPVIYFLLLLLLLLLLWL